MVSSSGELQGVACPSVLQCTAIDLDGREVTFDPTAPTDSVATEIAGASSLDSIACASVAECVVVDSAGDAFVGITPPPSITAVHQPPSITALHQSHSSWREGSALAHASAKKTLPVGTTFSFGLNESATVTFEFSESASGRKVGENCLTQTRKHKKDRRCTRTVLAGTLTFVAHSRDNKVHFEGLISKRKKLKPGSYTLLVTATASGEHSAPRTADARVKFTVTVAPRANPRVKALRGKAKSNFWEAVDRLGHEGCAAAHYRMRAPDGGDAHVCLSGDTSLRLIGIAMLLLALVVAAVPISPILQARVRRRQRTDTSR